MEFAFLNKGDSCWHHPYPHLLLASLKSQDAWTCGSHPVSMRQQAQNKGQSAIKDEAGDGVSVQQCCSYQPIPNGTTRNTEKAGREMADSR